MPDRNKNTILSKRSLADRFLRTSIHEADPCCLQEADRRMEDPLCGNTELIITDKPLGNG